MLRIFIADIRQKQKLYLSDGAKCSLMKSLLTDGTGAVFLYRLMQWCVNHHLSPLALIIHNVNKIIYGCVIGVKADFEEGLVLAHPIGVVINSKVKAGKGVIIESGVVIGDEKGKSPRLGSNIFIGAGAKIIGDVNLGDNIKIGANAVVVKSCVDNATLIGIPAKPYSPKTLD